MILLYDNNGLYGANAAKQNIIELRKEVLSPDLWSSDYDLFYST